LGADGLHEGDAQGGGKDTHVDAEALRFGFVGHVEGADDGNAEFLELEQR